MVTGKNTRNQVSRAAGILLLGGLLLKSGGMAEAAENYFENGGKLTSKVHDIFQDKIGIELQKISEEDKYFMDSMMEEMLSGSSYDRTLESHAKYNEIVKRISRNAINRTLKDSQLYEGLEEDINNEVWDLGEIEDNLLERILGVEYKEDKKNEDYEDETNIFNAKNVETRLHTSLSRGEVSGSLTLEDFNLGSLKIDRGRFTGSNRRLKAYLEKAIKMDIYNVYARLSFERALDGDDTEAALSLTRYEKDKNKIQNLKAEIGYRENERGEHRDSVFVRLGLFRRM